MEPGDKGWVHNTNIGQWGWSYYVNPLAHVHRRRKRRFRLEYVRLYRNANGLYEIAFKHSDQTFRVSHPNHSPTFTQQIHYIRR